MNRSWRNVLSMAGLLGSAAGPQLLSAQAPNIRVQGRVQLQYRVAGGDSTASYSPLVVQNGFEIRRLRIQTDVRFGDNITLVIQPSFEMGALRMRDAILRVGLTDHLGITMGQEKSPFQRYELNSSNSLPSIERGVRILGLSRHEAMNDLLLNNGYVSHDLGAFLDASSPDNRLAFKIGMQNGSRESTPDVNNGKSFYGRATAVVLTNADDQPSLQLGVSGAARDRAVCNACAGAITYFPNVWRTTYAVGLDAEVGGYRPGPHLIADFATGDNVPIALRINTGRNTGNLRDTADSNIVTFRSFHLLGAYRILTRGGDKRLVTQIEPALRLDLTDPNTTQSDDAGVLITPALNVYFANTVVLRAAVDVYRYRSAGVSRYAEELKLSWQANF